MRTQLLEFAGAVTRDPAIDAWFEQHAGELGRMAAHWFEVMRKCGDEVRELVHDGCPVACLGGAPFGYVAMTLRQDPAHTPGLCDAVMLHAAQQFKREGLRELSLGMSPFCPPRERAELASQALRAKLMVELNWKLLNGLFNYQGIAAHKRRWRGVERPVYYAGSPHDAVGDFFAAARLTGIL